MKGDFLRFVAGGLLCFVLFCGMCLIVLAHALITGTLEGEVLHTVHLHYLRTIGVYVAILAVLTLRAADSLYRMAAR